MHAPAPGHASSAAAAAVPPILCRHLLLLVQSYRSQPWLCPLHPHDSCWVAAGCWRQPPAWHAENLPRLLACHAPNVSQKVGGSDKGEVKIRVERRKGACVHVYCTWSKLSHNVKVYTKRVINIMSWQTFLFCHSVLFCVILCHSVLFCAYFVWETRPGFYKQYCSGQQQPKTSNLNVLLHSTDKRILLHHQVKPSDSSNNFKV